MQKVKFGKIELPQGDNKSLHIPKNGGKFIDHGDIMKTLAISIRDNLPVLLIGESGTGKTSAIRYLASLTGNGLRRINLNGGTTADELVGRNMIRASASGGTETYWIDGVLTEAMRKGEWVVLDEINAALPEVLFVLQSIMDDDGYLVLNEKDDKEIIRKHTNFRLFATCNPPAYAGTKEMNQSLLSRFIICINAEFPPVEKELEIIEHHLGNTIAKSEMAIKLVGMANDTRNAKEQGNTDYLINTRDIISILKLAEFMEPIEALQLGFANKLDTTDRKAVGAMAKLHLPASKKKGLAQRNKITTPQELKINSKYILDTDTHNAYFGLTKDKTTIEKMEKANLGEVIAEFGRDTGIKGDEFTIEATFYEGSDGAEKTEQTNMGEKVGSIISFCTGSQKGKKAVILHHKDIEESIKIIESLYEIS